MNNTELGVGETLAATGDDPRGLEALERGRRAPLQPPALDDAVDLDPDLLAQHGATRRRRPQQTREPIPPMSRFIPTYAFWNTRKYWSGRKSCAWDWR
jgi:hypothetical protein